jgi:hypothetical protein
MRSPVVTGTIPVTEKEEAVKQKPAKKYSFTVRYGVQVMDAGGITSIPGILYQYGRHVGLRPQDRDFIGH